MTIQHVILFNMYYYIGKIYFIMLLYYNIIIYDFIFNKNLKYILAIIKNNNIVIIIIILIILKSIE
jgi:hypothetical protein